MTREEIAEMLTQHASSTPELDSRLPQGNR